MSGASDYFIALYVKRASLCLFCILNGTKFELSTML